MFEELKQKYFETKDKAAIILGLQTGVIVSLYGIIHAVFRLKTNIMIMMLLGALIIGLLQTIALRSSFNRRLRYGVISSVILAVAYALGCYVAHSYWLTTLGVLILIPLVAFSSNADHLIACVFLFIADMFIVGGGRPELANGAVINGLFVALGGLSTCLVAYLWHKKYPIVDNNNTQASALSFKRLFPNYQECSRFGVLLTLSVIIGNTISHVFSLPQGYWVPMTAMLILKSDLDLSKKRIGHRLYGTLLGSGLAFLVVLFIYSKLMLALLMFPLMFLMVIALAKHYGAYTFFVTIAVTVMMNLSVAEGYLVTSHRLIDTILGVVSVVIVIWFLKPRIIKN